MRLLVTGASGFLGRHLLAVLEQDPVVTDVVALVSDGPTFWAQPWTADLRKVICVQGTLDDSGRWGHDPALKGIDGIFHLAAVVKHSRHDVDHLLRINHQGTLAMVHLAERLRARLVYVSTSGTVGCALAPRAPAEVLEDAPYCDALVGRWPYYASKILAEKDGMALARERGVSMVVVRPPVMLGPGDHRFRSTGTVLRFLQGRLPFLVQGGMHFVDIRDVAQALQRAMVHAAPRPIYHTSGRACSIDTFFSDVAQLAGIAPPRRVLPHRLALRLAQASAGIGVALRGEPLHLLPDPVVIEMAGHYWDLGSRYAEIDLQVTPTPYRTTLQDTIAWLRQHHPSLHEQIGRAA